MHQDIRDDLSVTVSKIFVYPYELNDIRIQTRQHDLNAKKKIDGADYYQRQPPFWGSLLYQGVQAKSKKHERKIFLDHQGNQGGHQIGAVPIFQIKKTHPK